MNRVAFLNCLLGKQYRENARGPDAWDCFHLMAHIERHLAGREFGDVTVPENASWRWMMQAVASHPDRENWRELRADPMGLVQARDLAVVLMARRTNPGHCGVWLKPERVVIHAVPPPKKDGPGGGVVTDTLADLHVKGWTRLRFYEPI